MANEIRSVSGLHGLGATVLRMPPTAAPGRANVAAAATVAAQARKLAAGLTQQRKALDAKSAAQTKAAAGHAQTAANMHGKKATPANRKILATGAIKAAIGTRAAVQSKLAAGKQGVAAALATAGATHLATAAKLQKAAHNAQVAGKTVQARQLTQKAAVSDSKGREYVAKARQTLATKIAIPVPPGLSKESIKQSAREANIKLVSAAKSAHPTETISAARRRAMIVVSLGGIAGLSSAEIGEITDELLFGLAEGEGYDDEEMDGLGWPGKGLLKKAAKGVKNVGKKAVGAAVGIATGAGAPILAGALGKKLGLDDALIGGILGGGKKGDKAAPPPAGTDPALLQALLAQRAAPAESGFPTGYVIGGGAALAAAGTAAYLLLRRKAA